MKILEDLLIKFCAKFAFVDDKGNKYYTSKSLLGEKRFIVYAKGQNPGNIPAKYYAWLHKLILNVDEIDNSINIMPEAFRKVDIIKQKAYYSSWTPKI